MLSHEDSATCATDMAVALLQAHEELEAAAAKNKELYDRFQAATQSLEEKCRVADQKVSGLVVGLQPHLTFCIMAAGATG